jgi:hypothetical protein
LLFNKEGTIYPIQLKIKPTSTKHIQPQSSKFIA